MNKKITIGYVPGTFDLFHVGHLNLLKNAKSVCDILIVGVTTDELCEKVKNKKTIINFTERCEIVKAIKYVDAVIPQEDYDKIKMWRKLKFNLICVGDDWYNTASWNNYEVQFKKLGVEIKYFPYTKSISSTAIREKLNEK